MTPPGADAAEATPTEPDAAEAGAANPGAANPGAVNPGAADPEAAVQAAPNEALAAAPEWRREPYRVLFPLGALLAWAGVLHWLLMAIDVMSEFRNIFHAQAQIQGFMTAFAAGFLLTAIPRRTGTAPPSAWFMAVAILAPITTTAAAWFRLTAVAQSAWMFLAIGIIAFAARRFLSGSASRRPPTTFVWIPLALLIGIAGSLLAAAGGIAGRESPHWWIHEFGRGLLLQGMFTGLVLGVGGMVIPLITRGESPPDSAAAPRAGASALAHVALAAALVTSFWIEARGHDLAARRLGLGLRAAVALSALLVGMRHWRLPTRAGWNAWLVWVSAWFLPLGFALAAAFPAKHKAGLHVTFVGGFALLTLGISAHVALSHGGHKERLRGRPWQVLAVGTLLIGALVLRAFVDFDPRHYSRWLGASAALFLAGTLAWGSLVIPRLRPDRR